MPRRLPRVSFNRHLKTRIIDVESPQDLLRAIEEAIREALSIATDDRRVLVEVEIFTDAGDYHCRMWVSGDHIALVSNIDESFDPSKAYRVMVELFEVSKWIAAYEVDSHGHLGFQPVIRRVDSMREVREHVARILRLETESRREAEAPVAIRAEDGRAGERYPESSAESTISGGDAFVECLSYIYRECAEGGCRAPEDPVSGLVERGFVAFGEGGDYMCVYRSGSGPCRYIVLEMRSGETRVECASTPEEAVERALRGAEGEKPRLV